MKRLAAIYFGWLTLIVGCGGRTLEDGDLGGPADETPTTENGVTPTIDPVTLRIAPVRVDVRTDWFEGRPTEIVWGDRRLPVTAVAAVRDESSAYPVVVGPRTVFEVETPMARLSLSFRHRTRSWTIEGLDEEARPAA